MCVCCPFPVSVETIIGSSSCVHNPFLGTRLKSLLGRMWHKRHRSRDSDAPAGKRLRDNLVDLYASGSIPGDRAQSLLDDAGAFADELGHHEMQDLRAPTGQGSVKNRDRDLRAKLLRRSQWPPVYIATIRCWSVKTKELVPRKVAFLLPHEVLGVLEEAGKSEVLTEIAGLDSTNLKRHDAILGKLGMPFVSLSLWGDGIPYSWDRRKSVDAWTLSLPGLSSKAFRDLRIALIALPHDWVARETQDDILSVFSWSFHALITGAYPLSRHDEAEWLPSGDSWRKSRVGKPLLRAALLEVKGDWKQVKTCYGLPGWTGNAESPICWRCRALKKSLWEETGLESPWLQPEARLSHMESLERVMEQEGHLSPLWSIPFMEVAALRLDWLHVCDQGITPVFLGGLFHLLVSDPALGQNQEQRCGFLWAAIQEFYLRTKVVDKLHNLVLTMIKPKKGSIELSGSGAQIRALVPFGLEVVNSWDEATLDLEKLGARASMRSLATCYSFLSLEQPAQGTLLQHALAFQANLQGLHAISKVRWQLRPKLHMFLELAAEGCKSKCFLELQRGVLWRFNQQTGSCKGGGHQPPCCESVNADKILCKGGFAKDSLRGEIGKCVCPTSA